MSEESKYIPRYRNISIEGDNALYNKCLDTLNYLHAKYYGSAINVHHYMVYNLKENIKKGLVTLSKYKKSFGELAYLCNKGEIEQAEIYLNEHPYLK